MVVHTPPIILASSSATRAALLSKASIPFEAIPSRVDEEALKLAAAEEGLSPRDLSDLLAEAKGRKIAAKYPDRQVIGSDQVLEFDGRALSKPASKEELTDQILALSGQQHRLISAVVIFENGEPVWRHVATSKMTFRVLSSAFVSQYIDRNWESVSGSVGGYRVEDEGLVLFQRIEGDHSAILGLPMIPLVSYMITRGWFAV